jgi:hypothetical protein
VNQPTKNGLQIAVSKQKRFLGFANYIFLQVMVNFAQDFEFADFSQNTLNKFEPKIEISPLRASKTETGTLSGPDVHELFVL